MENGYDFAHVREYDKGLRRMHVFPQPSLVRASLAPHQSKGRGANLGTDNLLGSNSCLVGPSVIFSKGLRVRCFSRHNQSI